MKYFPIKCDKKPESYHSGAGKFGANRDNGARLHSGCDLYMPVGTEVYATDEGIIRRISDKFYRNVGAIEIVHKTWIGRYCEITPLPILKVGDMIKAGQLIGYVAKIDGLNISMLHFEMYDDPEVKSPLTVLGLNKYNRRADLLDPTKFLDSAEIKK
jgi:murein DD-endopeptidase MepM/ murein hydrolase activator NlpD